MGNEESAQLMQGAGANQNDPFGRPLQANAMSTNFQHTKPPNQASSMLNSIGQLSNSFPNSIRPMNQLINQLNPGSFPNISSGNAPSGGGGGVGGSRPRENMMSGPGPQQQQQHQQQRTGPGPPAQTKPTTTPAVNPQVPEVDLSGLTEEEKMMIQSVMARAQEETQGPVTTPVIKSALNNTVGHGGGQPSTANNSSSIGISSTTGSQQQHHHLLQQHPQKHPQQHQQQTKPPVPMIGYPEQRRMFNSLSSQNNISCCSCRREVDQMVAVKCADCSRMSCAQCCKSYLAPNGQNQICYCADCAKRRQTNNMTTNVSGSLKPTVAGVGGGGGSSVNSTGSSSSSTMLSNSMLSAENYTDGGGGGGAILDNSAHYGANVYTQQQQQQQQQLQHQQQQSNQPQQSVMGGGGGGGIGRQQPQPPSQQEQQQQLHQQQSYEQQQTTGNSMVNIPQVILPGSAGSNNSMGAYDNNNDPFGQQTTSMQQNAYQQQQQLQTNNIQSGYTSTTNDIVNDNANMMMTAAAAAAAAKNCDPYNAANLMGNFTNESSHVNRGLSQQQQQSMVDQRNKLDQQQTDPFAALSFPPPMNHHHQSSNNSSMAVVSQQQQQQYSTGPAGNVVINQSQQPTADQQLAAVSQQQNTIGYGQQQSNQMQQSGILTRKSQKLVPTPPSVMANCEVDDYGYLDFEIDEEYEKQGEYDDEDEDDDEEEDFDDEEEEEDVQALAEAAEREAAMMANDPHFAHYPIIHKQSQQMEQQESKRLCQMSIAGQGPAAHMQHQHMQQQQSQSKHVPRVPMTGAAYHGGHPSSYYGGSSSFVGSINEVYTIPEEDEELLEQEQTGSSGGGGGGGSSMQRKQSIAKPVNVRHQLPDQSVVASQSVSSTVSKTPPVQSSSNTTNESFSSKFLRVTGPIQRILPSTSSASTMTSHRASFSSSHLPGNLSMANHRHLSEASLIKARNNRSNSEPFLKMIKPFQRGLLETANSLGAQPTGVGGSLQQQQQPHLPQNSYQSMGYNQLDQMKGQQQQQQQQHQTQFQHKPQLPQQKQQQQQQQPQISNEMAYNATIQQQQMLSGMQTEGSLHGQANEQMMLNQPMMLNQTVVDNMNQSAEAALYNNSGRSIQQNPTMMISNAAQMTSGGNQTMMPNTLNNQMNASNQGVNVWNANKVLPQQFGMDNSQNPQNLQTGHNSQQQQQFQQHQQQLQQQQQQSLQQYSGPRNYQRQSSQEASHYPESNYELGSRSGIKAYPPYGTSHNERQNLYTKGQTPFEQATVAVVSGGGEMYDSIAAHSMPVYNMANQMVSTMSSSAANSVAPNLQQLQQTTNQVVSSGVHTNVRSQAPSMQSSNILQSQIGSTTLNRNETRGHHQSGKSLQQFADSTWSHSTELSPILDVSPSVEAAEAKAILERRRTLESESRLAGTNMGIPRATSGTISGMIDDFNRAIETLSLNNNPEEMESNIRNKRSQSTEKPPVSGSSSSSGAKSILSRRASTGQVDSFDHYRHISRKLSNNVTGSSSTVTGAKEKPAAENTTTTSTSNNSSLTNEANSKTETTGIEALRQQKAALLATKSQIELQQLQKQQQILIQQQQQFLQFQLEQQRLQNQMNEQLSTVAKLEQQQRQVNNDNKTKQQLTQQSNANISGASSTVGSSSQRITTNESNIIGQSRYSNTTTAAAAAAAHKETVAVNTDISQQDGLSSSTHYSSSQHDQHSHHHHQRVRDHRSARNVVLKHDKQVSTSATPPPSSLNSTPTAIGSRAISQQGGGGGGGTAASSRMSALDGDSTSRSRVASASSSCASSLHRRLPSHPVGGQDEPCVTSVTAFHNPQQPQSSRAYSSVTTTSISQHSQGSNSPLIGGRNVSSSSSSSTKPVSSTRPLISKSIGTKSNILTSSLSSAYPPASILSKKEPIITSSGSNALTNTNTLNTLGYLDLDTKNVTFENDSKGKRRKLPLVPKDEEPLSTYSTRKLIKERLSNAAKGICRNGPPLKSSSSLDSTFGIGPFIKRPQSPYSSNSDISHFLASTYGRNILKSPSGHGLADVFSSKAVTDKPSTSSDALLNKLTAEESSKGLSMSNFANEIKNLQQKIMEELKTDSDPSRGAMLNNLTGSGRNLTNLSSHLSSTPRYDGISKSVLGYDSSVYPTGVRSLKRTSYEDTDRYGRRNASETRFGSLDRFAAKNGLPFKSYEYESLNPVRYSDNKYRLIRPFSSASFYDNDPSLRESSIPNNMNINGTTLDEEFLLRVNLFDHKRRFGEKELLNGSTKWDRLNSLYSKYDLATGLSNTGHRYSRHLFGRPNTSRSWHPSPYVSDVSEDEDIDHNLSVEEKAAKVRAEIKRRRQRLADSGRLYRHYSLDDYNILADYTADCDPLFNDGLGDTYSFEGGNDSGYRRKSKYDKFDNEYSLTSARDKYYSDDLDTYYHNSSGNNKSSGYNHHPYDPYGSRQHNPRLYDSRLSTQNYAYPSKDYAGQMNGQAYGQATSMPHLTEMSTRSSHKQSQPSMHEELAPGVNCTGYRSGYDLYDYNYMRCSPKKTQFAPNSTKYPKYPFPIKRILLTQDPKIRSMGGDGLGLKVCGGKEIPGTNMIGAYIQKIHPSLSMNEIREGMQVIEWNGIPLTGISHDEVSRIIANQIGDEIEVVIRTDINLLQDQYGQPYPPGAGAIPICGPGQCNQAPMPPQPQPPPGCYGYGGPDGNMPPNAAYYPHGTAPLHQVPPHIPPPGMQPLPPGGGQHMAPGPPPQQYQQPPPNQMSYPQPQVILQHNHPIDESMAFDHYDRQSHPMQIPNGAVSGLPPVNHAGMISQQTHMQQLHPSQVAPAMHTHNPMETAYYSQ